MIVAFRLAVHRQQSIPPRCFVNDKAQTQGEGYSTFSNFARPASHTKISTGTPSNAVPVKKLA